MTAARPPLNKPVPLIKRTVKLSLKIAEAMFSIYSPILRNGGNVYVKLTTKPSFLTLVFCGTMRFVDCSLLAAKTASRTSSPKKFQKKQLYAIQLKLLVKSSF